MILDEKNSQTIVEILETQALKPPKNSRTELRLRFISSVKIGYKYSIFEESIWKFNQI